MAPQIDVTVTLEHSAGRIVDIDVPEGASLKEMTDNFAKIFAKHADDTAEFYMGVDD